MPVIVRRPGASLRNAATFVVDNVDVTLLDRPRTVS